MTHLQQSLSEREFFPGADKPLLMNSVDFRDGQQSLIATRMTTEDMLPLLERFDQLGFDSIEMWGGATFDVCIRYLNEDPWERLRVFKKKITKTPLKMVLRGQNLVGYKAYPDDIVEKFIERAAANGIDIFTIFDALQDLRNCETAFKAVLKAGKIVEGSLQYNISPYHTIQTFVDSAVRQQEMGASSIHIEDMAGLMTPSVAYELTMALKSSLSIPVSIQSHCTGGMAQNTYWEAIRAGIDGIDVCTSALSLGTAHPPVESFVAALKGTSRDPKMDLSILSSINKDLLPIRKKYSDFESQLVGVDVGCLQHQIPGGMMSNMESQLKGLGQLHRLPEVMEEVVRVRADMGYPPLATPTSQMCGAQATVNVMTGKRYQVISNEMKAYCQGMYGTPPGPIAQELMEKALGKSEVVTNRPGDNLEPYFEKAKAEIGDLAKSDEDILTYAMFPKEGRTFLDQAPSSRIKYSIRRIS